MSNESEKKQPLENLNSQTTSESQGQKSKEDVWEADSKRDKNFPMIDKEKTGHADRDSQSDKPRDPMAERDSENGTPNPKVFTRDADKRLNGDRPEKR